jgi:hypothetical protein
MTFAIITCHFEVRKSVTLLSEGDLPFFTVTCDRYCGCLVCYCLKTVTSLHAPASNFTSRHPPDS